MCCCIFIAVLSRCILGVSACANTAPKLWNSLPLFLKGSCSKPALTEALKTHLFRTASLKIYFHTRNCFPFSFLFLHFLVPLHRACLFGHGKFCDGLHHHHHHHHHRHRHIAFVQHQSLCSPERTRVLSQCVSLTAIIFLDVLFTTSHFSRIFLSTRGSR